jgi:hypothetical protein
MAVARKTASTLIDSRRLWNAIDSGNVEELENVLGSQPVINSRDAHGVTPLMRAACYNRLEVVRALINNGADVNAVRSDGFTPLLLAIFYGHAAVVRLLCESGADVNVTTRFGTSAHMWAVARGFNEIADYVQRQTGVAQPVAETGRLGEGETAAHGDTDLPVSIPPRLPVPPSPRPAFAAPLITEPAPEQSWYEEGNENSQESGIYFDQPSRAPVTVLEPPGSTEPLVVRKLKEPLVVRTLQEPPDIWDLVHENESSFHAGSAFFARITSIRAKTLLALASILVGALCAFVALNWRTLLNRTQPAAVAPTSSSQVQSDAKPGVVNAVTTDGGNAQTTAPQQVAPNPVSTSTAAAPLGGAETGSTAGTEVNFPGWRSGSAHGAPRRTKRNLDDIEPARDTAEKSQPKSSDTADTASGNNRSASNAPAVKPPANGGNSQLIERPSGSSTPKPKTIQWP